MKAKIILAPIGVFIGAAIVISLCHYLSIYYGIGNFQSNLSDIGMPDFIFYLLGSIFLLSFLPFFFLGIITLGQKGAVGDADKLRTWGAYKYVRNPMYSGLSFSMIGIGLLMNSTGVIIAGFLWLHIAFVQCIREEKKLSRTFGDSYKEYKKSTPMFIPDFATVIKDFFIKVKA